jgi:hypothetical protein
MRDLLPHYEAELALLRRLCRGFAERYPGVAGSLLMTGDTCEDPHVERLIQASALLAARISKRLDDDYSLFTESLLEMLYPHYLRSFPSCSIVHLDFGPSSVELPEIVTLVPRGTLFKSAPVQGVKCKFRSTSDLIIAPITISNLQFKPIINVPTSVRLNVGATSSIEITFSRAGRTPLPDLSLKHLRLFLDAEPMLAAALRDTLFTRVHAAYIASGKYAVNSYNFKHACSDRSERLSESRQGAIEPYELYVDSGAYGFKNDDDGEALAGRRMEAADSHGRDFTAESNSRAIQPGRCFILSSHFSGDINGEGQGEYLIRSVRHLASNNYHDGQGTVSRYANTFIGLPKSTRWRPQQGTQSIDTRIYGVQTATVVGPEGEDIHTDEYGRVRIQFHWDRDGKADEKSSPWVRALSLGELR